MTADEIKIEFNKEFRKVLNVFIFITITSILVIFTDNANFFDAFIPIMILPAIWLGVQLLAGECKNIFAVMTNILLILLFWSLLNTSHLL